MHGHTSIMYLDLVLMGGGVLLAATSDVVMGIILVGAGIAAHSFFD